MDITRESLPQTKIKECITMPNQDIDLKELLFRESERVEWKYNVANVEDVVRTIVAFSNDYSNLGGGYVVCGAQETKDAYGFQDVNLEGLSASRLNEIEKRTLNHLAEKVDPKIVPAIRVLPAKEEDKRILIFIVPSTGYAHSYRASGSDASRYYIRDGSNTIEAKNSLLRELLIRKRALEPWDKRACKSATESAIDLYLLRDYLSEMKLIGPDTDIRIYLSAQDKISDFVPPICAGDSMLLRAHPRNFALLMFCANPLDYIEGAYTEFSIYRGLDRSEPSAEKHQITGTLVNQARRVIELLNAEAYVAFDKTDAAPNQTKYPVRALQEAVVNALVHRDYEMPQPTRITVFEDRIEIISPGSLPYTVDKEKFVSGKAHPHWRNQSLAYFFNKLHLAQAEGQGIPTILRLMKEEGCPSPVFELEEAYVICSLPAHPRHKALRDLRYVEQMVALGNYQEAFTKLVELIKDDKYNHRALDFVSNISSILNKEKALYALFQELKINYDLLPPNILLSIAEAFSLSKDARIKELSLSLITLAMQSRLEEKQILKAVLNLKKLNKHEEIISYLDEVSIKQAATSQSSSLLEEKGRAYLTLATRCMTTATNYNVKRNIKKVAWDECRRYLSLAEKDLNAALELSRSPIEREHITKDIQYLKRLRSKYALQGKPRS